MNTPTSPQFFTRPRRFLDGEWRFAADPIASVNLPPLFFKEYTLKDKPHNFDWAGMVKAAVPGSWVTVPGYEHYEGHAWYATRFEMPKAAIDGAGRHFLYFEGVNRSAQVYLNDELIGGCDDAYVPFAFEITGKLKEHNTLAVGIDSTRSDDGLPSFRHDWFNFGGILRPVSVVSVPRAFLRNLTVTTRKLRKDGVVALIEIVVDGPDAGAAATVEIPELGWKADLQTDAQGYASTKAVLKADLWSPEQPRLYQVVATVGGDRLDERIGFRTIATRGRDILLNGQPIFLRGICMHDESIGRNERTTCREEAAALLREAKDLNCNFVRLAHYPHNEWIVRLADEMGLLAWSEIPIWGKWMDFKRKSVYTRALSMLTAMIERDRNRASVIIWSLANETDWHSPDRNRFLLRLLAKTRRLDPTRLISNASMGRMLPENIGYEIVDEFFAKADVVAWNQYIGWYERFVEGAEQTVFRTIYEKPFMFSELGADGKGGLHGPPSGRWSEESQAALYETQIRIWEKHLDILRGVSPWVLMDFRSPGRFNQYQQGYNLKGLLDHNGKRKLAFGVLQRWYAARREETIAGKD